MRYFTSLVRSDPRKSVFWCGKVVFSDETTFGSVEVQNGKISACHHGQTLLEAQQRAQKEDGTTLLDLGSDGTCLSPGLVDVHVHISALGRNWEGYETATKAAAAGGITTIIGMPLNSIPPTTSAERFFLEKEKANETPLFVDVGLWGGVVPENCNSNDLNDLLESGVLGLKAFLSPLPPAAGYEAVSPEQLLRAAKICGQHNKPILVHSELMTETEVNERLEISYGGGVSPMSYEAHLNSRPPEWERAAVEVVCRAASHCQMHVVHLSDAGCLDAIREAKLDPNKRLSIETCPHYLLLDSSMIAEGCTRLKCFPPIRDASNRETLIDGLKEGLIDIIASDHSPCEASMRCYETGNMKEAWGGLSGLQYQLPATWTEAYKRGFSVRDMANWWSKNPCSLAGLDSIKGSIEVGKQADFCWWDPIHTKRAPNDYCREYHRWKGDTYYASQTDLRGRVLGTWVGGTMVYDGSTDEHQGAAGSFLQS